MVTVDGLEEGQGIFWTDHSGIDVYAVVVEKREASVRVATVRPMLAWTKCYDDGGAEYGHDKDNVRLRDCPPPFSVPCRQSATGRCYAYADMGNLFQLDDGKLGRFDVEVVDNGEKVSDRDMKEILCHPWQGTPEKELARGSTETRPDRYGQAVGELGCMACGLDSRPSGSGKQLGDD